MACRSCRRSYPSSRRAGRSPSTATRRWGTTRCGRGSEVDRTGALCCRQRYTPQERRPLRGRVEQQAVVVGAEHEAGAQGDVAARQLLVVDAAHAQHLVVAAAGGADRLVGLADAIVAELARNAHLQGEIVAAD